MDNQPAQAIKKSLQVGWTGSFTGSGGEGIEHDDVCEFIFEQAPGIVPYANFNPGWNSTCARRSRPRARPAPPAGPSDRAGDVARARWGAKVGAPMRAGIAGGADPLRAAATPQVVQVREHDVRGLHGQDGPSFAAATLPGGRRRGCVVVIELWFGLPVAHARYGAD